MEHLNKQYKTSRNPLAEDFCKRFECGCGKQYQSYAALYTHIKTKHDGNAPEGTFPDQSSVKRGRGRPRKEKHSEGVSSQKSYEFESDILREHGLIGTTNDPGLPPNPISYKYEFWLHKPCTNHDLMCDDIFGLYLIDLQRHINPQGFSLFIKYLYLFRDFLNKKEWDSDKQFGDSEYSSHAGPLYLPFLFNHFIVDYLPALCDTDREEGIVFSLHFTTWLYNRNFTTYKLNLVDYS